MIWPFAYELRVPFPAPSPALWNSVGRRRCPGVRGQPLLPSCQGPFSFRGPTLACSFPDGPVALSETVCVALGKVAGLPHVGRRRDVGLSSLRHPQPPAHGATMQLSSVRGPCPGRGSAARGAFLSSAASVLGTVCTQGRGAGPSGSRPCPVRVPEPWRGRRRTLSVPFLSAFLSFLPFPAGSLFRHVLRSQSELFSALARRWPFRGHAHCL